MNTPDRKDEVRVAPQGTFVIETEKPVAHCTPEFAAFMDADGSLQRAGLLIVDLPDVSMS